MRVVIKQKQVGLNTFNRITHFDEGRRKIFEMANKTNEELILLPSKYLKIGQ